MWGSPISRRFSQQRKRSVYLVVNEDAVVLDFVNYMPPHTVTTQQHLTLLETAALLERVAEKFRNHDLEMTWREKQR